jgi:hypothetical protein
MSDNTTTIPYRIRSLVDAYARASEHHLVLRKTRYAIARNIFLSVIIFLVLSIFSVLTKPFSCFPTCLHDLHVMSLGTMAFLAVTFLSWIFGAGLVGLLLVNVIVKARNLRISRVIHRSEILLRLRHHGHDTRVSHDGGNISVALPSEVFSDSDSRLIHRFMRILP